ncbi:MAG: hypothetical protein ABR941_02155 [Thermoleophilia bacterium]
MNLATAEQLTNAAASFDRDWGAVDEVLHGICERHPGHSDRRAVTAKIALVDRAYSAGLERQVRPNEGEQAIVKIAAFMLDQASEVDEIIAGLDALHEPLDKTAMTVVVVQHGRLTALLREITANHTAARSFAAKYLHFHRPVVPIYESYAAARLIALVHWDGKQIPFEQPPGSDDPYWDFCARFFRLYDACHQQRLSVTVKELDAYLWQVPA